MEQRFIVDGFLFPADEDAPKAIHPGMESFDDPTSCATAMKTLGGLLVTTGLDVRCIATSPGFATNDVRIKALVAAEMLRAAGSGARAVNRKAVERGVKEFLVVSIRAVNSQAQGNAAAIGQHRPLDAQFAPIRRIWTGFFPRPREPWCRSHPDFATSIGCREGGRNVGDNTSRVGGTRRGPPTPESSDEAYCRKRTPSERPSTGSRCGARNRCRSQFAADRHAGDRPWEICGTWAEKFPCVPTNHREYANSDNFVRRTFRNPP